MVGEACDSSALGGDSPNGSKSKTSLSSDLYDEDVRVDDDDDDDDVMMMMMMRMVL